MSTKSNASDVMRQALEDITEPIAAMQRDLPEGHSLNGHYAMVNADNPEHYKRIARAALSTVEQIEQTEPKRPLYIFDLDGTLADVSHRKHLIEGKFKDWGEFYRQSMKDAPIGQVIQTFKMLLNSGADVWVWSGRSDEVQQVTQVWLASYVQQHPFFLGGKNLKMRKSDDFTPDDKLKESWLLAMSSEDRSRLVAVFDDRDKVVHMWRKNGISCFQVAPGNF